MANNALAFCRIREALCVLGGDLNFFAEHIVGIGDTGLISVLELLDDLTGDTADKTDLVRLGDCRGNIAYHEGGLLRPENDAGHIGHGIAEGVVHTGKVYIRIGCGCFHNGIRAGITDSPAECAAVVDQGLKVGREIAALFGFDIGYVRAGLVPELLQAFPGTLVEGLVIDAAGICDHSDLGPGPVHIGEIVGLLEEHSSAAS